MWWCVFVCVHAWQYKDEAAGVKAWKKLEAQMCLMLIHLHTELGYAISW